VKIGKLMPLFKYEYSLSWTKRTFEKEGIPPFKKGG